MINNNNHGNNTKFNIGLITGLTQVYSVSFPSTNIGYAAGYVGSLAEGAVSKSINGGKSWTEPVSLTATTVINFMMFMDTNTGFTVGRESVISSAATISKTTDGGATWSTTNLFNAQLPSFLGIAFSPNRSNGIACGLQLGTTSAGVYSRTTDGGQTWQPLSSATTSRELRSVSWIDNNTAIMCGRNTGLGGVVWKTTNAGVSFTVVSAWTTSQSRRWIHSDFVDASNGFIVGSNGSSFFNGAATFSKTTNSGNTWSTVTTIPSMANAWGVKFRDVNNGMVVGWNASNVGVVSITTDGGTSWTSTTLSHAVWLYFPVTTSEKFWFCGASGVIPEIGRACGLVIKSNIL